MGENLNFDSVIVISQSFWYHEMRSNRYHYTTRFSKIAPVFFIQNFDQKATKVFDQFDQNITIVNPLSFSDMELFDVLLSELRKQGLKKPLFWIYTPKFISALKSLTIEYLMIYHATEAYFGSDLLNENLAKYYKEYLENTRIVINMSDYVIAVSHGVGRGISEDPNVLTEVKVVTNGCDFKFWSSSVNNGDRKDIVLYQGGIHRKLDFELIRFVVKDNDHLEFWFCGEETIEFKEDKAIWNDILQQNNFKYLGKLSVEEVLDISTKAKVGIIPFKLEDWLVEKSFPLKAFEYLSAGLEVVSTPIRALSQYESEFSFTDDPTVFSEKIRQSIKLSSPISEDRLQLCQLQDYDQKFKQSIKIISTINSRGRAAAYKFKKNVLVLYDKHSCHVSTIAEHINAFGNYSKNNVTYYNSTNGERINERFLASFEVLILHYSIRLSSPGHLSDPIYEELKKFVGLKILFIQDEYDNLKSTYKYMSDIHFDIVFTCVPNEYLEYVYPRERFSNVLFEQNLTGYISYQNVFKNTVPFQDRTVDVFYRGRELPYIYGSLGREKFEIGSTFKSKCEELDTLLNLDLEATNDKRIYGDGWYRAIANSKTMLGTESGSNVFDFDGDLNGIIEAEVANGRSYNEIYRHHLAERESKVRMNQISPKVFECISLKTVLILFEGEYSGVLEADEHYIELKKDFSNIQSVLDTISNNEKLEQIANNALSHISSNFSLTYESLIARLDQLIDENTPLIKNSKFYVPQLLITSIWNKSGIPIKRVNFIKSGFEMPSNTIPKADLLNWQKRSTTYLNLVLYPLETLKFKFLAGSPLALIKILKKINLYKSKLTKSFKKLKIYRFFTHLFSFCRRVVNKFIGKK
jgi:hypothetical protein